MNPGEINRQNTLLRDSLRRSDTLRVSEAIMDLCQFDQIKARRLFYWFNSLNQFASQNTIRISQDLIMFRMWQLGNVDIKQVMSTGSPIFVLTNLGRAKINKLPKDQLKNYLLWDAKRLIA